MLELRTLGKKQTCKTRAQKQYLGNNFNHCMYNSKTAPKTNVLLYDNKIHENRIKNGTLIIS